MTNANLALLLGGSFVFVVVWGLYTLVKITGTAKEVCSNELPYKVEPAEQLAVSAPDKPVRDLNELLKNWGSLEELNPKRKYTKRSSFWTAKRKKAAARKAKKKTSKLK